MFGNREALNFAGAFVATGLISILAFVTWALVFRQVPADNQNALTLLIGILSANVGMVVGFYFGSSVTNKKQADTIDTLARNQTSPPDGVPTVELAAGESTTIKAEQ